LRDGFAIVRVSIIIPAYNEAKSIRNCIAEVQRHFGALCKDYEVIVVDDGSIDGTRKLVETLPNDMAKLVTYDRNEGKGFAFRKGFARVTGEFTFLMDGDAEIMARDLGDYLEALRTTDIVIGSKRHPLSVVRCPPLRRFLSIGFNMFERPLTGVRVSDTQAGFKAWKSRVLYRVLPLITAKKFAFDVEVLTVASLLGYRVKELPVSVDLGEEVDVRQALRMLVDVLGIGYRLRIRRWYQKNIARMSTTYTPVLRW